MFLLGQNVGKYQILSNLGSGGFGTVFLAKDAWIDKKVAIKVPHRQTGDFDELLQEPRLLAALDHPNIVSILTAERVEGVFFIVMEYVKGESLEAVLDREKSLDVARAVAYTAQILKGVEHAHEATILHRDLRPANVLVSESGIVKVADFGTSRFLEKSHATTVIGSPPYMAPEQFQGRAVLASDLYSVGVMLYQMLTGLLPYFSPNPAQIERMVAQGRCTPPRIRNTQIPREISDIVMNALAKGVSDRYQRASELLDDLATAADIDHKATELDDIRKRLKAREVPKKGFCWNCRKPMHARSDACPFCGETQ
jgi:serine/threonine protein kinase